MAYSEYFNVANPNTGVYYNYADTTYPKYTCATSHSNYYKGWNCTSYKDHPNTISGYGTACTQSVTYANHVNYSNPSTGGYNPGAFISAWSGSTLTSTYITESVDAIKDLRNKIKLLTDFKGQNTVPATNVLAASGLTADAEFDGVGLDLVENEHYNALKDTLGTLWTQLNVTGTFGVASKNDGDIIAKTEWNTLKQRTDSVIACNVAYSNTVNYAETITPVTNHNNYCKVT